MSFDIIIVGAGSAGCVLANRLSQDDSCRVLLIEAGGEAGTVLADIPGAASWLQGTRLDWAFTTTPQNGLYQRRVAYPRGRVVGGTSVLNYMVYIRGNRGDYDRWRALGNEGWGYDDVLPYFKRAECNAVFRDAYHGSAGPLSVEANGNRHELCARYVEAAQAVGIPYNPDFNGARQSGCGYYQATLKDGRRCSAARAYLDPVRSRPNLTLVRNALVTRLLIERGRVHGVEYIADGRSLERVFADSEVVCAAGAIGSPQLLMLSGIGPAADLRAQGIDVRADLPGVGQDLQDHLGGLSVKAPLEDPRIMGAQPASFAAAIEQFTATGKGLLGTHYLDAGAFYSVDGGDSGEPTIQTFFIPGIAEFFRTRGAPDVRHICISCYVCRPGSRGSVSLASASPLDRPLIDPAYLSDPEDLRLSMAAIRRNLEILEAAPLGGLAGPPLPGDRSDGALEDFIRANASTVWHPTSTCRMGVDDRAVVDPALRVHGIEGLRVCDASVMPTMISGNTNAPVIMIAEKGADIIREGIPAKRRPRARSEAAAGVERIT